MEKYTTSEPFNDIAVICNVKNLNNNTFVLVPLEVSLGRIDDEEVFITEDGSKRIKNISELDESCNDLYYVCVSDILTLETKYGISDVTNILCKYYQEIASKFIMAVKDYEVKVYVKDYSEISPEIVGTTIKHLEEVEIPKDKKLPEVIAKTEIYIPSTGIDLRRINTEELEKYVKSRILNNDSNIDDMVTTIAMNYSATDPREVESMLSVGPTGSGKTETYKVIAEYLGVPVTIYDCNSLSATGYVGKNIEDIIREAYINAGKDVKKTEKGIIVLDEFDKVASHGNSVTDVDVQYGFLKLMDGYKYIIEPSKNGPEIGIDSSFMTIAACGAFPELTEKKQDKKPMGFGAGNDNETEQAKKLTTDDFVKYGIIREVMGRLTQIYQFGELDKESLKSILLNSMNSPLLKKQIRYKKEFNTDLSWTDAYIDAVVEEAFKLKTGGRGLMRVVAATLKKADREVLRENYTNHEGAKKLVLTEDTVRDNKIFKI